MKDNKRTVCLRSHDLLNPIGKFDRTRIMRVTRQRHVLTVSCVTLDDDLSIVPFFSLTQKNGATLEVRLWTISAVKLLCAQKRLDILRARTNAINRRAFENLVKREAPLKEKLHDAVRFLLHVDNCR